MVKILNFMPFLFYHHNKSSVLEINSGVGTAEQYYHWDLI